MVYTVNLTDKRNGVRMRSQHEGGRDRIVQKEMEQGSQYSHGHINDVIGAGL